MDDVTSYAVFLYPQAIETLGPVIKPYLTEAEPVGAHIVCSEIDPVGPFFTLTVQGRNQNGNVIEAELMLPFAFVKLVISMHSDHAFGFHARTTNTTGA